MERHGIEASHTVLARDEHHHTPSHHHHSSHGQPQHHHSVHGPHAAPSSGGQGLNFLSPEHAASNLSVPDCDGSNPRLLRGSSLKFSRQRARSFGPGQRRKSSFQRSGSMDTPPTQADTGHALGRLQGAKSDSLATTAPASAISMAAATLAVAFGGQTPNLLTLQVPACNKPVPAPRPANLTLKECYSVKTDKVPKPSSLNPARLSQDTSAPAAAEGAVGGGGRGPLTSVEVHVSDSATPCPPAPNMVTGATPAGVCGTGTGAGLKVPANNRLELPSTSALPPDAGGSWSTESLPGDSDLNLLPSLDQPEAAHGATAGPGHLVRPLDLLDCSQRPVFHQQVPPHALSLPGKRPPGLQEREKEEGATVMQLGVPKAPLLPAASHPRRPDSRSVVDSVRGLGDAAMGRGNASKGRSEGQEEQSGSCSKLVPSLRALTLDIEAGATGISGNFNDEEDDDEEEEEELENEAEVATDEEAVFTGDDSDHAHQYLAALPKSRAVSGMVASALPLGLPSPDEVEEDNLLMGRSSASASGTAAATPAAVETLRRKKRGSTGSHSQASSNGSKSQKRGSGALQGGKLKTPTTPLSWMVLRSPLARIESFHSDDFEYYNSDEPAEHASAASASPMSASTPTVPCFVYKLNMARKKPPKLKKGKAGNNTGGKTGKKTSAVADKGKTGTSSPM